MRPSFNALYEKDLSAYIKQKKIKKGSSKTVDYLEWSTVLMLLYKEGATDVTYVFSKDADGYPVFYNAQGRSPFVNVIVRILWGEDEQEFSLHYPVINGFSSPESPSQGEIHNAQQRAFVKAVAINTGLGLSLWSGVEEEVPPTPDSKGVHTELNKKIARVFEKVSQMHDGNNEIAEGFLGKNRKELSKLCGGITEEARIEKEEFISFAEYKIKGLNDKPAG